MDPMGSYGFPVVVSQPRSYMGPAELRVTPEAVSLTARPVRHYRAIVAIFAVLFVVLIAIGGAFSWSGQAALKDPALSGAELATANQLAYGVPLLGGLLGAALVFAMFGVFMLLRGDPRTMALPRASVSLEKRKGRLLLLQAPFDPASRAKRWGLSARDRQDGDAIASALTGPGPEPSS